MQELAQHPLHERFEQLYIELRKKEGRCYTDEEVKQLPLANRMHAHYKEWEVRTRSATRLINYLENKNRPLSILEAGCGNGWFSGRLAEMKNVSVTATDINRTELEQAKRVFGSKQNLVFKTGDIRNIVFENKFDVIVFAASIQYFSPLEDIIEGALWLLNEGGELHILDSQFYKPAEVEAARERSQAYYHSLDCEEMSSFYFHHAVDTLRYFDHEFLFDPSSFKNKLFSKNDPFPWIRITTS